MTPRAKWPQGHESLLVKFGKLQFQEISAARQQVIVRASHGARRPMNKSEFVRLAVDLLLDRLRRSGSLGPTRMMNRPSEAEILHVREFGAEEEELLESA